MIPFLLGMLSLLLLSAGIFHGAAPVFRDLLVLVIPLRHYARESVLSGRIPLWTDGLFFGAPFLADYQSAVFYPPSLIVYALPFPLGLDLFLAFHVLVGGWGVARYLTDRARLDSVEAAFGGIVFALGGFISSVVSLTNQLSAAAWLPWAAGAAEQLIERGRKRDFFLLTIFFLLQALSGAPEAWLMTTGLVFALAIREVIRTRQPFLRCGAVAAALLFAVGLAAFQLLPTVEYATATQRVSGLPLQTITSEALEPRSFLQFLLPHTFTRAAPDFVPEGGVPLFWSLYVGIAPLALAIVALSRQPFWTVALGLSIALSTGASTPLFPLLHEAVPRLVGLFRFPAKIFLISHLCLAVLAAHGLSVATRERRAGTVASWLWAAIALAALGVALASGRAPHRLLEILGFRLPTPLSGAAAGALAAQFGLTAVRTAALALTSLAVLRQLRRGRIARGACAGVIVFLTALELILVHRPSQVFVDWRDLDALAAGRLHPGERIFHYRLSAHAPGLEPWVGSLLPGENVAERARRLWASLVPDAPMVYGASAIAGSDGFFTRTQRDLFRTLAHLPRDRAIHLLTGLGVDRLIGTEPLGGVSGATEPRAGSAAPWEYALQARSPRIYLAENVLTAPDRAAALQTVADADFRPGRDAVVIDGAHLPTGGRGVIGNVSIAPGHLTAELSIESPAFCVVSDTWFEGWEATIDGEPAPIRVTNGLMRGVSVPVGLHFLEMSYRPRFFRLGWQISALMTVALAISLRGWRGERG